MSAAVTLTEALAHLRGERDVEAAALLQTLDSRPLPPVESARLRLLQGLVHLVRIELEPGMALALPALNELDALSERRELAWARGYVGFRLGFFGDPEHGLEYVGRALAHCPSDDIASQALFVGWRGCLNDMAGDSGAATADLEQALSLAADLGQADLDSRLSRWLALALLRRAERAEYEDTPAAMRAWAAQALPHASRAAALARRSGLARALPYAQRQFAHALALLGDVDAAATELAQATASMLPGDVPVRIGCLGTLARIARQRGDHDDARRALEEAVALADRHHDIFDTEASLRDLVQLEAEVGRWPEALAASRRLQLHIEERHRRRLRTLSRHAEAFAEAERHRIQAEQMRDEAVRLNEVNQQLAHSERRWRDQALQDALTGLSNRRGFEHAVADLLAAGQGFDLALIDVDHFKRVNDRFGHAVGDQVLASLARLLAEGCRQTDRVARLGGEEFVLLLPQGEATGSQRSCERLRAAVEAFGWADVHPELAVTISLGLAHPRAGEDWQAQLERADQALYAAKQGGRNQLRLAD